ncbi:Dinitrogenase iron-molybdenum cofactor [anaerobic digester metagenome]|jgi:predicted Fe-Mo cluster-binding NifX family protein
MRPVAYTGSREFGDIMRIAIAQDGNRVSEHFGHCGGYAIFDVEDSIIYRRDDLPNPGHEPGRLPVFLAEHGVNLIIAGGMGPRAVELFNENGIQVLLGISGNTDYVAQDYIAGRLTPGKSSCHHEDGGECDGHH